MNSDNIVNYWQSQLLNLSNRYPTSGTNSTQADMDSCSSLFKTLVQTAVSLLDLSTQNT